MRIGVDSGGTFTDFVIWHDGKLSSFKLRSRPSAPDEVIAEGVSTLDSADLVHGSTVATNALLERKGARTAFIATQGFADLLEIGRQNRDRLYDLTPGPRNLLIPRDLCFEVAERVLAGGIIESRPTSTNLAALRRKLSKAGVQSAAVCFLHAWAMPDNELAVGESLPATLDVSLSHQVCPEFREYERASTTALNAYLSPIMRAYLSRLEARLARRVWIMQSNGGSITVAEASRLAIKTLLSGPAGGVRGAVETARASGFTRILGFDMGGTSTDVSLADGDPVETLEARVDGLPVKSPMLEIHTVGAGGGSIAHIDSGGLLRVGPESAGADPGPACYGAGSKPTVTDAHVVLGRIAADQLAGGALHLHPQRARDALSQLGRELSLSQTQAAAGVLRIANATMSRAIRVVSTERGHDPRDFTLVAFGGCGGLHACEIAEELGIRAVLVPRLAGALSALGMLLADRIRDYSISVLHASDISAAFSALENRAANRDPSSPPPALRRYPLSRPKLRTHRPLDQQQPRQTLPRPPPEDLRLRQPAARYRNRHAAAPRPARHAEARPHPAFPPPAAQSSRNAVSTPPARGTSSRPAPATPSPRVGSPALSSSSMKAPPPSSPRAGASASTTAAICSRM